MFYFSEKNLISSRFPGLLINGSVSDSAYKNFLESREESADLGVHGCSLETIMNEAIIRLSIHLS